MRNSPADRERRKRIADENAAARANRTDQQQIERLRKSGHRADREITRLGARIAATKKEKEDG